MKPFCTVLVDGKLCGGEPDGGLEVAMHSGVVGVVLTCREHAKAEFDARGASKAPVKVVGRIAVQGGA